MGDPLYWLGFLVGPARRAGLGWMARRYAVVRRLLAGVTESIHERKGEAAGEETGEHAIALRALTTRIASEMLERGLTRQFDRHLADAGHNPEGSPLRDVVRRARDIGDAPTPPPEPLADLSEMMAGPDTEA